MLALYTDGLVERPGADIDDGIEDPRDAVPRGHPARPARRLPLSGTADLLTEEARQATERPDDIALLHHTRRSTREVRP